MNTLLQDLKYGLRMLAKNRGFTTIAVLTLALGIGANTTIFSVVNGVLLNPLPYHQPDQLVALYSKTPDFTKSSISYPNFLDWVRDNHSFSALAAYRNDDFIMTGLGEAERVPVEMISSNFFSLLGVEPLIGRSFHLEEDQLGTAPVALISEGLWKRRFGSSPEALGKTLMLNGTLYTIVGVISANFSYHAFHRSEVYLPIGQWREPTFRNRRTAMGLNAVGRLKPGITVEQAKADMEALAEHLAEQYPETNKGSGITLLPLKKDMVGDIQPFLLVLIAAVGFVLLIACVNVANLLLARSTGRAQEFAIRTALGASGSRIVRQLLTESILLALAGGGLGLLLATWGTQFALRALPEALPRAEEIHLDGRVLLFTLAASTLAGILFGLVPALKAMRAEMHETLKEGGRGSSGGRHRAQRVFVVGEMALALILLVGAGLMIRSLAKLWKVDPGFNPHNVVTFYSSFPPMSSPAAIRAMWRQTEESLNALPGVIAASLTVASMPLGSDSSMPFWLEDKPKPTNNAEINWAQLYIVQPGYLKVMGIPLKRGRFITAADNEHSPFVIVIDDRFAQLHFGNQDPIGRRLHIELVNITAEIVGVVGHIRQYGLDQDATAPHPAQCYFHLAQMPEMVMSLTAGGFGAAIRTEGPPLAQVASIRQAMNKVNNQQAIYATRTMDQMIAGSLAARRFLMILLGVFAALALIMSCVGIYSVISYLASQRTHEIGIRMALGADRREVLRMVLREGTRMTLLGIVIGIVGALALTRLMASMLFGISAHDPLTLASVASLLVLVGLVACYIPARRATKVDPMVALRYE
ncbi:MAG: ABC transporter permease [Terriglobia bacterium]